MKLNLGEVQLEGGYDVELPTFIPVKQTFDLMSIPPQEIPPLINKQFQIKQISQRVKPGMKIAVGVGSRGITNLSLIVKSVVIELKRLGAEPFIVPAMGSHGAGKADLQAEILTEYGIFEENIGAPIRAGMETVYLGQVPQGVDVFFDKLAYEEADGIIVVSRIKPHTDFKGPIESGIMKMLGIGLGKHKGASYLHRGGIADFADLIPAVGKHIIDNTPFLFGLGIIENAYHDTAHLEIVLKEELLKREAELLVKAKQLMPRLLFDQIDVLVVEEIGKNISGSGMDSNIIGRSACDPLLVFEGAPKISKIVVLNLTKETNGNATGIGLADFTTGRTVEQIDFSALYANATTAIEIGGAKLPVIMENDRKALIMAIRTAGKRNFDDVKIVHIKNTLELNQIFVSENLRTEVEQHPNMQVIGESTPWKFDSSDYLVSMKEF
ncbi:DUF2088 domain-containing protein [bacterium LRH843]|nr:DUF2088 domain-containing protein [bacterium LRH843]